MTYEQAMDFIHSRLKFGSILGLNTIGALLERLSNPHEKLRFIHVAGTNGKGSTSTMIANILKESGFKTGLYISPFINSFSERIQINGEEISKEEIARFTAQIIEVMDENVQPTEFEVVTAIGFLHFLNQNCDYVVLEVGLGGRFDATNIIQKPVVSVITSISLDHTELLGDTVDKIAFEKCGIIKQNCPVVAYADNEIAANEVITKIAAENNSKLIFADKNTVFVKEMNVFGTAFIYQNDEYKISMLGMHQVYNALTAITVAKLLEISIDKIQKGLVGTKFAGRFEIIHKNPVVIIDGAHNYSGILAFKDTLLKNFKMNKKIIIMGMLKDKEYEKCIKEIAEIADVFIATEPENLRKLSAREMADVSGANLCFENKNNAIAYALENAEKDDVICVCGSLYLIGGIIIN